MSEQIAAAKIAERAESSGAMAKLLSISIALAVVPISAFFGTQKFIFPDEPIYAAVAAIVSANVILMIFVVLAAYEDKPKTPTPTPAEIKKNQ